MIGRHIWANGARSPDAPREPCWYTTGSMSLLNMSMRRCTVSSCTPEYPYERDWTLRRSISFTISGRTVSPVPQACDITRLCWSCDRSSAGMVMLQSEPNPVVTPYTGRPMSSILLSRNLRHLSTASSDSLLNPIFWPLSMISLTFSIVRCLLEIVCVIVCSLSFLHLRN